MGGRRLTPLLTDLTLALAALGLGTIIGTLTGVLPGLHVNTVAPVVLAFVVMAGDPASTTGLGFAGAAMLLVFTVATVHTVLNVVPTLAAPIPDDGTELMLLPVQRLAREGRALDALRLSVRGSWTGGLAAGAVGLLVLFLVPHGLPKVPPRTAASGVALIVALLVAKQPRPWRATALLLLTGVAGLLLLPHSLVGPFGGDGSVLLPAFAGLFGTPMLLLALLDRSATTGTAPEPAAAGTRLKPIAPLLGAGCGLLVALLPGLTSATAGTIGRSVRRPSDDAEAVGMLSAVDTANVVGNTAALVVWGAVRSGASSAAENIEPGVAATGASYLAAWTLGTTMAAVGVSAWIALRFGGTLVARLRMLPPRRVAGGALALLLAIVLAQAGPIGLLVTACLLPLGLLPHRWGVPRALLMGFLLVPYLASALV